MPPPCVALGCGLVANVGISLSLLSSRRTPSPGSSATTYDDDEGPVSTLRMLEAVLVLSKLLDASSGSSSTF
tara:strand:- start:364 stop:579 length:216 start_codon:yes stop_codon:yes gene_type:complete